MTAIRKFLFERSFDAVELPPPVVPVVEIEPEVEPVVVPPTFSEQDLEAARGQGFTVGKEEGLAEALARVERQAADALAAIADRIGELFQAQAEANEARRDEAVAVGLAVARKLFPELNRRHGLAEVEHLVRECMERLLDEPRIAIHVSPELSEPLAARIGSASSTGFRGEVSVSADSALGDGDCRIEWANGGAERSVANLWQQIDEVIERNLGPSHPARTGADAAALSGNEATVPADGPQAPDAGDATAPEPITTTREPGMMEGTDETGETSRGV